MFQKKFKYRLSLFNFLRKDMLFLYKIIISILKNIQNNFLIKKITSKEYNNNLVKINCIYESYSKLNSKITFKKINSETFFKFKKDISEISFSLKEISLQSAPCLCIEILTLFNGNNWFVDLKLQSINNIKFYDAIFVPTSCIIENKCNYINMIMNKEEGYVFFKNIIPKKDNVIEELNGAKMYIYVNKKVICFSGYFNNDSVNIIRNHIIFCDKKQKVKDYLSFEVIPDLFKKKYLEQISLRDFVVLSSLQIKNMITDAFSKLNTYKSMSLGGLLLTFINSSFDKQREILTILILSDFRSAGLASLLYETLAKKGDPSKAKQLYMSLHISIQKLFDIALDDFNNEINKLKNITEEEIPYDKRIVMTKASENAKTKAMEKFKSISKNSMFGGGSQDTKAQHWLNGFLKIPFGIYKKNQIISFVSQFSDQINKYMDIVNSNNNELYESLECLAVVSTEIEMHNFISVLNESINNSTKYLNNNLKNQDIVLSKGNSLISDWNNYKIERRDYIKNVRSILDEAVYGNNEGKTQIEGIIGQWINGKMDGAVLGFQGPPGVGKTTLAKRGLCKCLMDNDNCPRPFAFISLGGSSNGATLEGHGYTYIGSIWGKITDVLMESKCMNPIIFFDEVDKISRTEHGREITGILTHITDLTQNDEFEDRYFAGIKLNLSKALLVFSYNDSSLIDPILRDRITEIRINPLNTIDKIEIVKDFLMPEILESVGYKKGDILIEKNEDIEYIIDTYTYEAGVRKLKEKLIEIIRIINLNKIYGQENITFPYLITREKIEKILSRKPKVTFKKIAKEPSIGLVNGLYATSAGVGGLTIIEVFKTHSDKKFGLTLTGQQGDVMKESISCAKTIAWNLLPNEIKENLKEDWEKNGPWGLHVHTPEGATPKDGPSAGGAITLAILSRLAGIKVKNDIAMTGEINLNGQITKIGGLTSKILGAVKAGVTKILIPGDNEEDLIRMKEDDIFPKNENLEVVIIHNIFDILENAFVENDIEFNNYRK